MLITIYTEKGNSFEIPFAINPLTAYSKVLPEKGTFVKFPQITGGDQFTITEAILILPYYKRFGKNFISICAEFIDWSRSDVAEQIVSIGEQFTKTYKLIQENILVL